MSWKALRLPSVGVEHPAHRQTDILVTNFRREQDARLMREIEIGRSDLIDCDY